MTSISVGIGVSGPAQKQGYQIFVGELRRFADEARRPGLTPIIERLATPLRIAVRGRAGVGRGTVERALTAAGVDVTDDHGTAEVHVVVVAEVVKPEDRAAVAAGARPTMAVLNKADLVGFGPGGPVEIASRRSVRYRALIGVPVVPMIALLGAAALDDELVDALCTLATDPVDLRSTDAFVNSEHRLPRTVRARLRETLDLFGIAHAVLALRQGVDAAALPALLRSLSHADRVLEQLEATGAEARYRRLLSAAAELEALAITTGDERLAEFLRSDEAVMARMAAAVDVVQAAGPTVDPGDGAAAHRCRAARWQRYGRGPVTTVHRACGADIARGSLRLLHQTSPPAGEVR
ncbi:MAG: hypothetical protein JWR37_2879 [Mycobacterium sp.]|nr:hypothetical protein [Mycobacterium sp.]